MANPRKFSEKIALLNQKQAEETAKFEQIMKEVLDVTSRTALNNLEEMQHNQLTYRGSVSSTGSGPTDRSRPTGVGPMRSRPIEKRHDTSPYSGVPYLSPPLPETWRRTNSDSALHQSANEACQANASMAHRRADQRGHGGSTNDNRNSHHHHHHHGFIERPRSSCEMPRVPGINVYPSSQPPGQQIPIGNNTGSLPDLSNVHFPTPHIPPLDQEDHSSGSPYSNNHLSVPVNHRYLHSCKQGLTMENNTSSSQQDVRITYSQQVPHQMQSGHPPQSQPQAVPGSTSPGVHPQHSPGHYNMYQPQSPVAPHSPNTSQAQVNQQNMQGPFNPIGSYRTSQMVNRPSPQSSPSLTLQGSPLSYSNNPSAPSSPTGHHGPPNLALDPNDRNVFMDQVHADLEQFSMMDSPSTTIGPYMNSPSHSGTYTQSDILSVASELGSGDGGYFSTSPLQPLTYHTRTPTTTQQLTPQTPNTPTITLTDCSLGPDDLGSSDFSSSIAATFGQDLFPADDQLSQDLNSLRQEDINALRQGLDPLALEELQRLANSDMVISDPTTEADFRLEQR